jgi:hypothetical protein
MSEEQKYLEALRIMNEKYADEYYDDKIKDTLQKEGIGINDKLEQRIFLERTTSRKKTKKKNFIEKTIQFILSWF